MCLLLSYAFSFVAKYSKGKYFLLSANYVNFNPFYVQYLVSVQLAGTKKKNNDSEDENEENQPSHLKRPIESSKANCVSS